MSDKKIKAMIANTFLKVANALETGQYDRRPAIGFASEGNGRGQDNIEEAMKIAETKGLKTVLIEGEDLHKRMEEMLDSGKIDGVVAIHYPFPTGVFTVRKVIIPDKGKPMHIVTTTDTSDTDHISGMVKGAIYRIIAARADDVENPTVGIANIDGTRQAEKAFLKLAENGYDINFAESVRADGGIVMKEDDLLGETPDIMVMDSLAGNLTTEVFSPYTTGGNYESLGFDYGPGMGEGYDRLIVIVSRASDTPIIAGAMEFATNLVYHDWRKVTDEEFGKANEAGLRDIINELKSAGRKDAGVVFEEVRVPPKEVATSQVPGTEVMDLEDIVKALWKAGIYAESGMGYIGPVVLTSDANKDRAHEVLKAARYVSQIYTGLTVRA